MRITMFGSAARAILPLLVIVLAGCGGSGDTKREEGAAAPAQEQRPTHPAPPPPAPPEAPPAPAPDPGRTAEPPNPRSGPPAKPEGLPPNPTKEQQQAAPQRPAREVTPQKPDPESKVAVSPAVIVLKGAALGNVQLDHKGHTQFAGSTCATCHHPSRPEKPATAPQQACSDCHTKAATPPMKTKYQAAFHNPTAQAGTCVDCHKSENAKGKKAPIKCNECHKK